MKLSLKKKGVVVQVLSSYSTTFFSIISGLFFVPLYLKVSSLEIYGAWLASGNIITLLAILEGGFMVAIGQRMALSYEEKDYSLFSKLTFAGVFYMTIISIIIISAGIIIANYGNHIIKIDAHSFSYLTKGIIYAAIGSALSFLVSPFLTACRAWHKMEVPALISIVASLLGLVAIYMGLFHFEMNISSIGFGAMIRGLINFFGVFIFFVIRRLKTSLPSLKYDKPVIVSSFKNTVPLFVGTMMNALINNSKELLLSIAISPGSAAILSITNRIYSLVTMIFNPVANSLFSALSAISNQKDKLRNWVDDLSKFYTLAAGLTFGFLFSINYYFISTWVGEDKYGGTALSFFLCLSAWLAIINNFKFIVLNAHASFRRTAAASTFDFIVRVTLLAGVFFSGIEFKIYMLPLIEVISTLISYITLETQLQRSIMESSGWWKQSFKTMFFVVIGWLASAYFLQAALGSFNVKFELNDWVYFSVFMLAWLCAVLLVVSLPRRSRNTFRMAVKKFY